MTDSTPSGRISATLCGELGRCDAVCGGDVDAVDLTVGVEHVGGDVNVEGGQPGAEEVVRFTEGEDPDDLHFGLRAVGEDHSGVISEAEPVVLGRPAVDGDLAQAVWVAAAVEGGRAQLRLVAPGDADERRARGGERLTVEVDQLGVAADRPFGGGDAVDGADVVDQLGGDASPGGRRLAAAEVRLGADRDVHVAGDVLEELVDGPVEGVGDDEGSGDEPDAQDDREGGEEESDLVVPDVAEAEAEHRQASELLHPVEDPFGGGLQHLVGDAAVGEEDDAVAVARRGRVVGDHDHGLAELVDRAAEELEGLGRGAAVEVAGGFVGEDDLGVAREGSGDGDALLLPAGELAGPVVEAVTEPDGVDDGVEPGRVEVAAGEIGRELDVLERGEGGDEVEGLEHEADAVTTQDRQLLLRHAGEPLAGDLDLAGGEGVETSEAVHEGRLAASRRTHDGGEHPLRDVDGDMVEGPDCDVTLAVDLHRIDRTCGGRGGGQLGWSIDRGECGHGSILRDP